MPALRGFKITEEGIPFTKYHENCICDHHRSQPHGMAHSDGSSPSDTMKIPIPIIGFHQKSKIDPWGYFFFGYFLSLLIHLLFSIIFTYFQK